MRAVDPNGWVLLKEAAEITGLTANTLRKRIRTGAIPKSAVIQPDKGHLIQINRNWLAGYMPSNVTQFPVAAPPIDAVEIGREIARNAVAEFAAAMSAALDQIVASTQRRAS